MSEQRYPAVLAVIGQGRSITEVADDWGVSRQTVHAWLARYDREAGLARLETPPGAVAAALDTGRAYDRDLPALAQALADVAVALDRRPGWRLRTR